MCRVKVRFALLICAVLLGALVCGKSQAQVKLDKPLAKLTVGELIELIAAQRPPKRNLTSSNFHLAGVVAPAIFFGSGCMRRVRFCLLKHGALNESNNLIKSSKFLGEINFVRVGVQGTQVG